MVDDVIDYTVAADDDDDDDDERISICWQRLSRKIAPYR